ncbi:hypothetical protein KCP77_08400 [Salmonella enterica subsp. enterica]|nr:hypothetical protein KCP77_08400 [Salmonella enterica subsp. enterica]
MGYNGAQAKPELIRLLRHGRLTYRAYGGMDERQRTENIDIFGAAAGDGYLVGKSGNQFYVTKVPAICGSLRTALAET